MVFNRSRKTYSDTMKNARRHLMRYNRRGQNKAGHLRTSDSGAELNQQPEEKGSAVTRLLLLRVAAYTGGG